MTSTSSRLSETVQSAAAFSYAQAAKGRTPSTVTSAQQTNQTSGVSTPLKDSVSVTDASVAGSEKGVGSVNGSVDAVSRVDTNGDASSSEQKETSASKPASTPVSPSFGTASTSTLPREDKDDDFVLVGHPELAKDRHIQGANATDRGEEREGRRAKKGKKQKNAEKEAEKEKEEVKPEVLVPAPIPTVNIWQQRSTEAAKTKPLPTITSQTSQTTADSKGRGKTVVDDASKLNGVSKESTKGQKKGSEIVNKSKDDSTKRFAARGSRSHDEKDEVSVNNQIPPPVEDATLWPTPETALEEDKRKAQEKSEKEDKEDSNANKPRPKDKWVTVPYIPTVTFNTPMPTRGARGRGGARGGRTEAGPRSGVSNGEKANASNSSAAAAAESGSAVEATNGSVVAPAPHRQATEQVGSRSTRKSSTALADKSRNDSVKSGQHASADIRNHPQESLPGQGGEYFNGDASKGYKQNQAPVQPNDNSSQPRSNRQSESGPSSQGPRERTDGRPDRGRGTFRGRGGHSNGFPQHPQHAFTNGHAQLQNGFPVRQSTGPYSPPLTQPPFSNQYPPGPARNGRNSNASRSQSIPNSGMFRQFGPGMAAPQHVPSLQTQNPMYDYSMQPLSAGPYNYAIDNSQVLTMVTIQLDYYFSIDNLCKDVFLRKHMDSKGFVFLSFIAGFKRLQSLTQDYELLKAACIASEIIESVKGDDGHERLRRKDGWEKWVVPVLEERDESARHAGPTHYIPLQQAMQQAHRMQQQQMMASNHYAMAPQQPFSPNGTEHTLRPYTNGVVEAAVNGNINGYHTETPLSAAVADFAPGAVPANGHHDPLESEVTFSDDRIGTLHVVVNRPPVSEESKSQVPFHTFASRTFSNGSIDERSLAQEIHDDGRQGREQSNGNHDAEHSPEDARRATSPFTPLSPTKSPITFNAPPVMWVKGQQPQPIPETDSGELYTTLHTRALKRRENSKPGETHPDMKVLYGFWSHFLVRNFNLSMYYDFRQYAFEDSRRQDLTGITNLITYYDEILNSKKKIIPEALAAHYVDLVKNEEAGERPAFQKLRAAWRNGALDLKSRKRIDNLVGTQLREELESGSKQRTASS